MPGQVDPGNALLLEQHAACAAVEAPLLPADDAAFFGPGLAAAVSQLATAGASPARCCTPCAASPQLHP